MEDITPQAFFQKVIGWNLDDYVTVINAPTADKPYHETYTVRYLGNVEGGRPVKHLNLTMDEFKAAVIAQMQAGKVVITAMYDANAGSSDVLAPYYE